MNEETDWRRQWIVDQDSLCIMARRFPTKSKLPKSSSWLPNLLVQSNEPETAITTRFKSPPVLPTFGLKCIAFTYSVNVGQPKTLKTAQNSTFLALLLQQKGYTLFVCSLILYLMILLWYFGSSFSTFSIGFDYPSPFPRIQPLSLASFFIARLIISNRRLSWQSHRVWISWIFLFIVAMFLWFEAYT